MKHRASNNGCWRVLGLRHQWWMGSWVWHKSMTKLSTIQLPPYFALLAYTSLRKLVRKGLCDAVRLVAPDGTIAAEEYATFRSVEGYANGVNWVEKQPIRWPSKWKVNGKKRLGEGGMTR